MIKVHSCNLIIKLGSELLFPKVVLAINHIDQFFEVVHHGYVVVQFVRNATVISPIGRLGVFYHIDAVFG